MLNSIEDETGQLPPDLPRTVTPEIAAANPDVRNIVTPRLTMLMEIANSFLLTIMNSLESVPYGIRWICKQIRSLTRVSSFLSPVTRVGLALTMCVRACVRAMRITAKIPRGERLRHLFLDRRLLLSPLRQPGDRHPASVHAH